MEHSQDKSNEAQPGQLRQAGVSGSAFIQAEIERFKARAAIVAANSFIASSPINSIACPICKVPLYGSIFGPTYCRTHPDQEAILMDENMNPVRFIPLP